MNNLFVYVAFIMGLTSCTYMTTGIFYSVENEELIPDAGDSLNNSVTVNGISRLLPTTFVSARSLFKKTDGDSEWSRLTPPEWGSRTYVLDTANGSGRIFAIVSDANGENTSLFHYNGTSWTASTGSVNGTPVGLTEIYGTTGNLVGVYLSVRKSNYEYDVHDLDIGTGVINAAINLAGARSAQPVLAASNEGANFYLTFGDGRLFKGPVNNLTLLNKNFGADLGGTFTQNQNFPVANTDIIVTLSSGKVAYSTDNGDTWTYTAAHSRNSGETPLILGLIHQIGTTLVAGSKVSGSTGGGYYEIVSDGAGGAKLQNPTILTASDDNYLSAEISTSTITSFYTEGTLTYCGTLGFGLFKQNQNDKRWSWE